jgi:hypothetical protein
MSFLPLDPNSVAGRVQAQLYRSIPQRFLAGAPFGAQSNPVYSGVMGLLGMFADRKKRRQGLLAGDQPIYRPPF